MISSVELVNPSPWISLREIGIDSIRRFIRDDVTVLWNRDGEIRRIPASVLVNALRLYQDAVRLVLSDRLAAVAEVAHVIRWEQAEPLSNTNVALNPRVTVGENAGGGGGIDRPS